MSSGFVLLARRARLPGMRGALLLVILGMLSLEPAAAAKKRGRAARTGSVVVTASVSGAQVSIDGKPVGETPLKPRALAEGEHVIKIKKLGHLEYSETITVRAGETTNVIADLLPFAGVIKVKCNVAKAAVAVDGTVIGTAPLEREVKIGGRTITVSAQGHETFTHELRAEAGRLYVIDAKLAPASAGAALDGLALMPLEGPTAPMAELDLELPLEPAGGGSVGAGGELGLEALPLELVPGQAPDAGKDVAHAAVTPDSGLHGSLERPKPWYMTWWAWSAAGALVTGVAVTATMALRGDGGEQQWAYDVAKNLGDGACDTCAAVP